MDSSASATRSQQPIRVLIVDDSDVVRSGLSAVLFIGDLEVVGEAQDGQEAIRLCDELQPDVVLMDLLMPILDGVAATRAILHDHPRTRVIALTSFGDEDLVRDVIQAGAISYLIKSVSADDLLAAIRAACVGQSTFHPDVAEIVRSAQAADSSPPATSPSPKPTPDVSPDDLSPYPA